MSERGATPAWVVALGEGTREEWPLLVAGMLLVGMTLLGLGIAGLLPEEGLAGFVGCFLLVYAALMLLQHPRSQLLGDGVRKRLRSSIAQSGQGFYGLLCLGRFIQLEVHDLLEALGEFELGGQLLRSLLQDWLIGFSMESLMNFVQSVIWPVFMFSSHGMFKAGLVLAALWGLYRFGGWLFPAMQREIEAAEEDEDDDTDSGKKRSRKRAKRARTQGAGSSPASPPPTPPPPPPA
ncbi:hypothetical protein [Pseudomarimonas salicorniae]|uniref:Intracellular septation protein A n=1 Tax=Pseudomarimonas salicorniae TaxID=2933270 RepID=A0ABT0GJN0_9GAMM|nr:hypothetical protein [Lysobacter sp. CAU 1642]MCK7594751.1 hypothetical protein [Lysobacter sp. CAU 1642]